MAISDPSTPIQRIPGASVVTPTPPADVVGLSQFVHYGFSVGAVGWERGTGSSSVALTV